MDFSVHWPARARRDLKRIVDYWKRVDADAIPHAVGPIVEKIESLAESPYSGDIWQRSGGFELRVIVAGSYRVFFDLDPHERVINIRKIQHVREEDPDFSE